MIGAACGHGNREGAMFCRNRGVSLAAGCPPCGTPVQAEDAFCDAYGHLLAPAASLPAPLGVSPAGVSLARRRSSSPCRGR